MNKIEYFGINLDELEDIQIRRLYNKKYINWGVEVNNAINIVDNI